MSSAMSARLSLVEGPTMAVLLFDEVYDSREQRMPGGDQEVVRDLVEL